MLKSMTGFGRGEYLDKEHRFIVEIKAVNHRYNEVVVRMPKNLGPLEDKIRASVAGTLQRGRIDVFITMDDYSQKKKTVRVDRELAIAYDNAMKELSATLALPLDNRNIYNIAKYPDILKVEEVAENIELIWPKLSEAISIAVENLMTMRITEGNNIAKDLSARIDRLEGYIEAVRERAPQIVIEYREKLTARMKDVLSTVNVEVDDTRLLQEAALFADRMNFTEELVRLSSHLEQLRQTLSLDGPIGRKLDFILQEINRETNTIASKANDYAVTKLVVDIKSEIEKIREQIQNIE